MDNNKSLNWWLGFSIIVALSFATRFYKIEEPDHVCWDETHFGKMGSWYIKRTFFFDVHPPLGKMLIALSGYLTGYNGSFPFDKPGDKYVGINYVGMRVFCTFLGACLPPLAYLTIWELTFCVFSSFLGSSFILLDVGILTLTQYILLDPILMFFVMCSTYGMAKFHNCNDRSFSPPWFFWIFFTGTSFTCSFSVKFVGLFVVLLVGSHAVYQLWEIFGDLSRPVTYALLHFIFRLLFFVIWPVLLYFCFFFTHLHVLQNSGNGDGFFSSGFQSTLRGNSLYDAKMPIEVAYGAIITLKNQRAGGGYLHSHWNLYPSGFGPIQQQITAYTHKDDNNKWLIKPFDEEPMLNKTVLVKNGDLIRLEHVTTERNLHSHNEKAPITRKHFQVTGYGSHGVGDSNDIWKIEIINGKPEEIISPVKSKLRLFHYLQPCVLTVTGKQLPKWGFEQQEVTCNPNLRDKFAIWNIEDNIYEPLPNISFQVYAPSFIERLLESHAVMLQGNAGLKPKEGEITSRPWQWPINFRGQFFSGGQFRIYLLGNPIIWWGNIFFLILNILALFLYVVMVQREYIDLAVEGYKWTKITSSIWLLIGWVLHYIPFWVMGRVLYFHHYFPALLYSSMLSGITISHVLDWMSKAPKYGAFLYHTFAGSIIATLFYSFWIFSPLSYGMNGPYSTDPSSVMYGLKWLDSWEF